MLKMHGGDCGLESVHRIKNLAFGLWLGLVFADTLRKIAPDLYLTLVL